MGFPSKRSVRCARQRGNPRSRCAVQGADNACLDAHCIVSAAEINPLGAARKKSETKSSFPFGYKFRGTVIVIVLLIKVKLFMKGGA